MMIIILLDRQNLLESSPLENPLHKEIFRKKLPGKRPGMFVGRPWLLRYRLLWKRIK